MLSCATELVINMSKKFFLVIALLVFVNSTCVAKSEVINVEEEIPEILGQTETYAKYSAWPQADLQMSIFRPNTNEKTPAIIFVPGGWWIVAPKDAGNQLLWKLAESGFAVAGIEYRTIVQANYVDIVGDVKAAVRYLRAHADELNIDENKIAIMGASAGGWLASMVGVTDGVEKFDFGENLNQSSKVQAVIDIFGPSDLTKIGADYSADIQSRYTSAGGAVSLLANGMAGFKNNKGGSILNTPETAKATNPITYINEKTPPFLIFHGNKDTTISPSQSKILYDALTKKGIDAKLYFVNGAGHEFKYFYQPKTFNIIVDFLNRVFK